MIEPCLRVLAVRPNVVAPTYASDGAAGLDLAASLANPLLLVPGEWIRVQTGLRVALPRGHEGQVRPRSGLAARYGITVLNAPGTIDEDYRGEIEVILIHLGREPFTIHDGDRIAQLVIAPVTRVQVDVLPDVEALGATRRAEGGFGSTGR